METLKNLLHAKIIGFLLLAAALTGIYFQTLDSPFVLDDLRIVEQYPEIRDISNFLRINAVFGPRPLVNLSFAMNYHFTGLDVKPYHAANVIIHAANVILVYMLAGLIFSLSGKDVTAEADDANRFFFSFFAAALFALHPIQSQPVIYISQRATLMACFFYLLSVICYMLARRSQVDKQKFHRYLLFFALCVVFGFMAFLSKENTASLPLAILLTEMIFFTNSWDTWEKRLPLIAGLLLLMILAFAWIAGAFHGDFSSLLHRIDRLTKETADVSRWQYFCTQFTVILLYMRLIVLPFGMNIDHNYPMKNGFFEDLTPVAFMILLGMIILSLMYQKKFKSLCFGVLWFFIALSVESSIIPIRDAMFEHRVYLAFPGISIIFACLLTRIITGTKTVKLFIFAAIMLSCTLITFSRAHVWKSDLSLWQDAATKAPHNARAWNNYGNALADRGQKKLAVEAFQQAIRVNPEYARPYCNLGKLYAEKGDLAKSEKLFLKSIELDPRFAEPYNNLAINYAASGNLEKGILHFKNALSINNNMPYTHYNLGKAYLDAGHPEKALEHFLQSTSLKPDINPMAYYLTAAAYAVMNKPDKAALWVQEAIKKGLEGCIENVKTDPRFASCQELVLNSLSSY